MAFNVFLVRKYSALFLSSVFGAVLYVVGDVFYGLWGGVGFFFGGVLLSVLLGNLLLRNPFSKMLEGKGILSLNIDSTGIIVPFLLNVKSPYILGKLKGREVSDVFDRSAVFNLAPPIDSKENVAKHSEGKLVLEVSEREYNKGRFGFFHFPVILWNEQINSLITKDWLSTQEKDAFAEHGVLYLNRKMEELTSEVRDFGRYVVETLKPKSSFLASKWLWIIVVGLVVVLLVLFAPAVLDSVRGVFGQVGGTLSGAGSVAGGSITPS